MVYKRIYGKIKKWHHFINTMENLFLYAIKCYSYFALKKIYERYFANSFTNFMSKMRKLNYV